MNSSIRSGRFRAPEHSGRPRLEKSRQIEWSQGRLRTLRNRPPGASYGSQAWVSAYAKEENIRTLDFAQVLFDSKGIYLKGKSGDGKYPSLQGYEAMGKCAVEVLGGG